MVPVVVLAAAIFGAQGVVGPPTSSQHVSSPDQWVPFSAQLKVTHQDGSELPGRFFRDHHGCERQELPTGPNRSTVISIKNFEKGLFYRKLRDRWMVQPMKLGAEGNVPHPILGLKKLADPHEGLDVYEQRVQIRGPTGATVERVTVAPELNFYRVIQETPLGRVIVAHNIRLGPQDHSLFDPPHDAVITEMPGYGGVMKLSALVLQITFPGLPARELLATEETATRLPMPDGSILFVVTSVVDAALNRVRVRILSDATGRPGAVRGTVLDEVDVVLGGAAHTTKLRENIEIGVVRINDRFAR